MANHTSQYTITTGLHPDAASCHVQYTHWPNWDNEGNTRCFVYLRFYDRFSRLLWTTTLGGLFPLGMDLPRPPAFALEGRSPAEHELNQFYTWSAT